MDAIDLQCDEMETIDIDIKDTVSAIVDNKLEYKGSSQGPSFADLFADVKPLGSDAGAEGDGADTSQLATVVQNGGHPEKEALQNANLPDRDPNGLPTVPMSPMVTLESPGHIDHAANTEQNADLIDSQVQNDFFDNRDVTTARESTASPEIVPILCTQSESKSSTDIDLDFTPTVRTVTVETEASEIIRENKTEVSDNSQIETKGLLNDNSTVSNNKSGVPDATVDLDEGIELNDLLQAQTAQKPMDDFDDEFDFDTPAPKLTSVPEEHQTEPPKADTSATLSTSADTDKIPPAPGIQYPSVSSAPTTEPEQSKVTEPVIKPKEQNSIPVETVAIAEVRKIGEEQEDDNEAEDEWANVQTVTPSFGDASGKAAQGDSSKIISYVEALQMFQQSNLDRYKGQIMRTVPRSGFKKLKHALFGPPKLSRDNSEQRDLYLCMSQYSFENDNADHVRMLQTLNKRLTGAKFDCPRHGSHWEHIGFQGNDPSTDLRGCGMLGLLQLIYITTTPKYLPLTREIYRLSLHETQNFPFCIMAINMTRMTIQALREECLNKEINRQENGEDMLSYMMRFYTATFYHLFSIWKSQQKTIADTGFVLRDVEAYIKKNPARLLADLELKLSSKNAALATEVAQEAPLQFSKFNEDD